MKKLNLLLLVFTITCVAPKFAFSDTSKAGGLKNFFAKKRCKRYFKKKNKLISKVVKSKDYCDRPEVYKTFISVKLKFIDQQYFTEYYYVKDFSKKPYRAANGKTTYPTKRMSKQAKVQHSKQQYRYMNYNRCIDKMLSYADKSGEFVVQCSENEEKYQDSVRKGYVQSCFDKASIKINNDIAMNKCSKKNFRGLVKTSQIFSCVNNLVSLSLPELESVNFCSDKRRINVSISGQFNSCYQKTRVLGLKTRNHLARCNTYEKVRVVTTYPYVDCVNTLKPYSTASNFDAYVSCEDTRYIDRSLKSHYSSCISKLEGFNKDMADSQFRCATSELFQATKESNFNLCVTNTAEFNNTASESFNLCNNQVDINSISSSEYLTCGKKMQTVQVSDKTLSQKCVSSYFQKEVHEGGIVSCVGKINNHTKVPDNSLIACLNTATLVASKSNSFHSCLNELEALNLKEYAINSCAHHHKDFKPQNKANLNKCYKRSIESAQGGYFEEVSLLKNFNNLEDISDLYNPIAGVLKDCSSDLIMSQKVKLTQSSSVKLIQDFHFSSDHLSEELNDRVGGLSALNYDADKKKLYAISDGKNNYRSPTIIEYKLKLDGQKISMKESGKTVLKSQWASDPEGLARLKNGNFIITTETGLAHEDQYINQYDKSGNWKSEIRIPKSYKNRSLKKTYSKNGFQHNRGLEALAVSQDEKLLAVANEEPLEQDINHFRKNLVRLTLFENKTDDLGKNKYTANAQYTYKIEDNSGNGLVELLFNEDGSLYALERGYQRETGVTARLFKINIDEATNVLEYNSLNDVKTPIVSIKKELVLDFKDIENTISAGFRKIDNLEGMTFGPTLPNGNKTLIIVSDNNFSTRQFTQFLVLELKN